MQESLRTGSQVEILAMKKSFVQQVQDVTSLFKTATQEVNLESSSSQNVKLSARYPMISEYTYVYIQYTYVYTVYIRIYLSR